MRLHMMLNVVIVKLLQNGVVGSFLYLDVLVSALQIGICDSLEIGFGLLISLNILLPRLIGIVLEEVVRLRRNSCSIDAVMVVAILYFQETCNYYCL